MLHLQREPKTLCLVGTLTVQIHKFVNPLSDLKATVPVWKAVRNFASVLLALVIQHSLSANADRPVTEPW